MTLIKYEDKRFRPETLERIGLANEIIDEYEAQGYSLTLRQLYYQLVARDYIPNTERSYKNLGKTISDGRLAGLISWDAIVDRTRSLRDLPHWENPSDILEGCRDQYRREKWADQPMRIEVWIEKDALVGVIDRICRSLDVPYFSCRGYTSQSEMWSAAQRMIEYEGEGQDTLILHLGDHDPSGIDMTRDIQERLYMFGAGTTVDRIALNMNQVRMYNPPPNPAKTTDARFDSYRRQFGDDSWELDALEPKVMTKLIQENVEKHLDVEAWSTSKAVERAQRNILEGYYIDALGEEGEEE